MRSRGKLGEILYTITYGGILIQLFLHEFENFLNNYYKDEEIKVLVGTNFSFKHGNDKIKFNRADFSDSTDFNIYVNDNNDRYVLSLIDRIVIREGEGTKSEQKFDIVSDSSNSDINKAINYLHESSYNITKSQIIKLIFMSDYHFDFTLYLYFNEMKL